MIKRFTTLVCALVALLPAFAADIMSVEEWEKICYTTPLVTNTLTELPQSFGVRVNKPAYAIVAGPSKEPITIKMPNGTVYEGLFNHDSMFGLSSVMFGMKFTDPGEYELNFPAQTLLARDALDEDMGTNPEYTVHYTVEAPKPPVTNPLLNPVMVPASGTSFYNIKNNIGVQFEGAEPGWSMVCCSDVCVILECIEGNNKGDSYTVSFDTVKNWQLNPDGTPNRNQLNIAFDQPITEIGTYKITFYKNCFSTWAEGQQFYNQEFSAIYYIVAPDENVVTLSVAKALNDNPISNFGTLVIEFPQCNAPEQGIREGYEDYRNISLTKVSTNEIIFATGFEVREDEKSIKINFDPAKYKDNGEYRLNLPAGIVRLRGTSNPIEYNPDLQFFYTLQYNAADSVEETFAEGDVVAPVYDLMGRTVLESATAADIERLPAGLYIFNGMKYVVK